MPKIDVTTAIEDTQEFFDSLELCDCGKDAISLEPTLSVEDARLLLNRRLIDCGWKRAKIDRYLNTHLPIHNGT